jgi:two-component system sensor histidine kinase RpfC
MPRLLRNYLTDSAEQILKIEAAAKAQHYSDLYDYCHALKGNSLSVGAVALATLIEATGRLSASSSPSKVIEALDNLNKEFAKLNIEVENYLRRPKVASSKI